MTELSNCCQAPVLEEDGEYICLECKEHCILDEVLTGTASYSMPDFSYENLYRIQARLKWVYLFGGIIIGIAIGLSLPAKAVDMSAHVEESPMRECINKCGYNLK